jgi:tetratricopeptide (TPR) repeat protein
MTDPTKAVFISYAREDTAVAQAIAELLQNHGIEVWFDRKELVGGDAWDAKIRSQIRECTLFVAVISQNTNARLEGYFRREWKLAIDRTHDMADEKAFLLPVVVDDQSGGAPRVPEKFYEVQWIHLPDGMVNETLAHRVQALLGGTATGVTNVPFATRREMLPGSASHQVSAPRKPGVSKKKAASYWWWLGPTALAVAVGIAVGVKQPWRKAGDPVPVRSGAGKGKLVPGSGGGVRLSEARQLAAKAALLWEKWDDATQADWALAEDLLKRAVEINPADGDGWAGYAQVACGQYEFFNLPGTDDLARTRAENAVRLAPASKEARLALANAYRTSPSTLPEAERLLRELSAKAPRDKRVLRTFGYALQNLGRHDEAIAYYDRSAALTGGDPLAWLAKSQALRSIGRHVEAEATVDQALALHAGPAALLLKMDFLLNYRGDLDGAAEMLAKVPASFLLDDRAISLACQLWLWKRQPDKCLAVLSAVSRDFIQGYYWGGVPKGWLVGRVHQLGGRPAAAEAQWRAALRTVDKARAETPDAVELIFWSAHLQASLGEKARAEKTLDLALQLSGTTPEKMTVSVAAIKVLLGRTDKVFAFLESELKTPAGPTLRVELRLDPAFDPLRGNPRFEALLKEPEE